MANTHYHLRNLTERSKYHYIYFDSDGDMILTVPVVGGGSISTDNTCKSSLLQDAFFSRYQTSHQSQHPGALQTLIELQHTLSFDLSLLRQIGASEAAIAHKQQRLDQVNHYITDLNAYIQSSKFQSYYSGGTWHMLTETARTLIQRHSNVHAMLLSPQGILAGVDDQVRFGTEGTHSSTRIIPGAYTTSYARPHATERCTGTMNLRGDDIVISAMLDRAFAGINGDCTFTKKGSVDARQSVIQNAIAILGEKFSEGFEDNAAEKYPELISALETAFQNEARSRCSDVAAPDFNISKYGGKTLDYATLKISLMLDKFEEFSDSDKTALQGLIENLINMTIDDDVWRRLNQGTAVDVFYDPIVNQHRGTLGAAVQFYFAIANIFANTHDLSNMDFGEALESSQKDDDTGLDWHEAIPQLVLAALQAGEPVDMALMNFINRNYKSFNLSRPFNKEEIDTINTRFNINFNIIKNTNQEHAHFDEFLTFVGDVPGDFVIHDNAMSYPFSRIMTTSEGPSKISHSSQAALYKRINNKISQEKFFTPQNIIPAERTLSNLEIEITSENIRTLLGQLSTTQSSATAINLHTPQRFAELLLAETARGRRLFEILSKEDRAEIMKSRYWQVINTAFRARCTASDSSLRSRFGTLFNDEIATIEISISADTLRKILKKSSGASINQEDLVGWLNGNGFSTISEDNIKYSSSRRLFEISTSRRVAQQIRALERQSFQTLRLNHSDANVLLYLARKLQFESGASRIAPTLSTQSVTIAQLISSLHTLRYSFLNTMHTEPELAGYNDITIQNDHFCITCSESVTSQINELISECLVPIDEQTMRAILTVYNMTYPDDARQLTDLNHYSSYRITRLLSYLSIPALTPSAVRSINAETSTPQIYAEASQIQQLVEISGVTLSESERAHSPKPTSPKKDVTSDSDISDIPYKPTGRNTVHHLTQSQARQIINTALESPSMNDTIQFRMINQIRRCEASSDREPVSLPLFEALYFILSTKPEIEDRTPSVSFCSRGYTVTCSQELWNVIENILEEAAKTKQESARAESSEQPQKTAPVKTDSEKDEATLFAELVAQYGLSEQSLILKKIQIARGDSAEDTQPRKEDSSQGSTKPAQPAKPVQTEFDRIVSQTSIEEQAEILRRIQSQAGNEVEKTKSVNKKPTPQNTCKKESGKQSDNPQKIRIARQRAYDKACEAKRPGAMKRFFRAILYFFYEIFHWCKKLSFNAIKRKPLLSRSTTNGTAKSQARKLIESLCSPNKSRDELNVVENRNMPVITQHTATNQLLIHFEKNDGYPGGYKKSRNLAYTLKREGIRGVRESHHPARDIVSISDERNQNRFFQILFKTSAKNADEFLQNFDTAEEIQPQN